MISSYKVKESLKSSRVKFIKRCVWNTVNKIIYARKPQFINVKIDPINKQ